VTSYVNTATRERLVVSKAKVDIFYVNFGPKR